MIYGNADGFRKYFRLRGKALSESWTDEKIESALLVASDWLDSQFETSWIGYKTGGFDQERSWPRTAAVTASFPYHLFNNDEIPEQVIKATYEAAYREVKSNGCLQTDFLPTRYKSVSVSGAVSVDYNDFVLSAGDAQLEIPAVQSLMEPLLDPQKTGSLSVLSGKAVRV